MVSKFYFTPPLKSNKLFPISYSKFHYPCIETHLFESNFHSLPSTLTSPKFTTPPPPLNFYSSKALSSWRHGLISPIWVKLSLSPFNSLSPETFSSIEVLLFRNSLIMKAGLDVWRYGGRGGFDVWKSWFLWVWEWFHGETSWYSKIWVLFGFGNI